MSVGPAPKRHARALSPETLVVSLLMAALSAVICMQIISRIGITPNTSIIGAILAMGLARIPLGYLARFRSLERQNLVQTMASAGGFAAANLGLLSVAILYLLGKPEMVVPMLVGAAIAGVLDLFLVYRIFDSDLYPASNAWPPGVATAQAIFAGDEGGHKAMRLVQGVVVGAIGTHFRLPMAGIGIVFIANVFAMGSLGVGLVLRGYSTQLFGLDIGKTYIAHGFMIGAGLVALAQAIAIILRGRKPAAAASASEVPERGPTVSPETVRRATLEHFGLFVLGAVVLALVSGIWSQMSVGQLVVWTLWAAFAALVSTMLVGLAAMHSGWFPAFAITVIFLTLGLFMGIPAVPLALLTGFVACTGPVFADMGYDLKTGWLLRGRCADLAYELEGRREQLIAELVGVLVAMVMVGLFMKMHFALDQLPPISRVYASTVQAVANPAIARELLLWAIPGALLQAAGGPGRAMGILFATGLLIKNPIYGIGVLVALVARLAFGTKWMEIREAGLIAGDGLYGFFSAVARTFF